MIPLKQCRALGLIIVGILSGLLSGQALAESYMYLTNNTMAPLTLNTQQTGHNNIRHGDQWQQLATEVPPLATVKFLRFNRDQGIKWGKEYVFTTRVNGTEQPVYLKQKLLGTMTFSNMWLSAQNDPWYDDRDIHYVSIDGQQQTLAFKSSSARTSGDDIHYVIHNQFAKSEKSEYSNELNVLTYNTWALLPPLASKNTGDRLDTIAQYMDNYDVVVFQEVFDPILTAKFRANVAKTYPYMTEIPWKVGKILTGGSFIASRWPIETQDAVVYNACRADGCLAGKGMNYAKIRKGSNAFHIFGTHTHAYTSEQDVTVRFEQLAQLKRFIDSKHIPYEEPVIMAGDFNVDKINYPQEHLAFLALLDATEPEATGAYPYSYAGPVNIYADDKFNEYLDYVLYSNGHLTPYASENKMLTPRSINSQHWKSWDLSDHYPVEGRFAFPLPPEYMPY
ncbi:sphingomyelin phosphodiesterase [Pseudoalteromonas sp. MMG005]|uniref:sphingomyelin phosphodiesterase n=1 Tax=Pseudoalteromonas sp. MMG005 TaxID=2822682 RepID=UPI001B39EA71|nr:sphingomyelin phosphodiesterase [Pseudoalteromonas sp. MMG005]MBQ4845328.1 sphingomyelin phosphodiesterase [Pseudoalteromonas sp. MMG005]